MNKKIKNIDQDFQIIKNVKVTYFDGKIKQFRSAILTKQGLFIVHFKDKKSFVEEGFIPRFNLKEIEGEIVKKIYKRIL
jgi:hypothetical protein